MNTSVQMYVNNFKMQNALNPLQPIPRFREYEIIIDEHGNIAYAIYKLYSDYTGKVYIIPV